MTTPITEIEKTPKPSRWTMIIAFVLAAILLYLAFRGVAWDELLATLQRANVIKLLLAIGVLTISLFLRGVRWGVLLSAEKRIPSLTMYWATCVGYLGNALLPARAGEVMRTVAIGSAANMRKSYVFATAMTERILDAVTLVLISLFALTTLDNLPDWLMTAAQVMGVLGLISVAVLFVAPRLEGFLKKILHALPFPETWRERLSSVLEHMLLGMRAFQHGGRALLFALLTILVWLMDAVIAILIAQALGLNLSLAQSLLLLAALGLSSAAPSTPGYVGIYQFVAVTVLPPFGFSQSEALAYIILFQGISYITIVSWGFLGLWQMRQFVSFGKRRSSVET